MIIGITGATGFVGRAIVKLAHQRGHEVIAFSRDPSRSIDWVTETRAFSTDRPPDISGCDAIIHLAGEPIVGVWTKAKQRRIIESRVEGTRRIVEAISAATQKPEVLVNASAIGFYGDGGETELTENSPQGPGFLAETTAAWEAEARKAATERVVLMRTSVVLGRNGGPLHMMLPPFRLGLGGPIGSGHQWMSWIHLDDLTQLFLYAVEDLSVRGAINATAPWPVRHGEFVAELARQLHRPALFRIPAFAVKLALRGLAAELLESKRVVPAAVLESGFGFKYPELPGALKDLLT